jgi:hypothetical protein
MKVAKLITMLEQHNLQADIKFKTKKGQPLMSISTMAPCKCKEKEIILTIGE